MATNRISQHAPKTSMPSHGVPTIPHGFAICPPQLMANSAWQQEIYRLAYERAKAATQLPWHHRLLFSVWN